MTANSVKIVIHRQRFFVHSMAAASVVVNGKKVAKIKNDQTITIEDVAANAKVQIRQQLTRSNVFIVPSRADEKLHLRARLRFGFWGIFFFVPLLFATRYWILESETSK